MKMQRGALYLDKTYGSTRVVFALNDREATPFHGAEIYGVFRYLHYSYRTKEYSKKTQRKWISIDHAKLSQNWLCKLFNIFSVPFYEWLIELNLKISSRYKYRYPKHYPLWLKLYVYIFGKRIPGGYSYPNDHWYASTGYRYTELLKRPHECYGLKKPKEKRTLSFPHLLKI